MTGLPAGCKLEINFSGSTWTDVSADVDGVATSTIRIGRTDEYSAPAAGTFTITLANDAGCSTGQGSYTPGRQVLYDGVTTHPYYPNVVPRKGIRFSYTISAVTYYRFTGFIKSWKPTMGADGMTPRVVIQASDAMDRFSRIPLLSTMLQEISQDTPAALWALTDAQGSTTAAQTSGTSTPGALTIATYPYVLPTGTVTFGANGPGSGDGTSAQFTPNGSGGFQFLTGDGSFVPNVGSATQSFTMECWFNTAVPTGSTAALVAFATDGVTGSGTFQLTIDLSGFLSASAPNVGTPITTGSVCDGSWHHAAYVFSQQASAPTRSLSLYLDGSLVSTVTANSTTAWTMTPIGIGGNVNGRVGYVAVYNTALSSTRIAAHAAAGTGYYGDTTGARVQRILTMAGLTSSNWNVDTGKALVNTYPQAGKTVLQYCQDMAVTEGGGSAFYVTPDGKARFCDRTFRATTTPAATVDAGSDLSTTFTPAIDDLTLSNQAIVSRSTQAGVASTQTVSNTASITLYQLSAKSISTYTTTDSDALTLGQYVVASQSTPGYRLPQVTVDLMTATTAGLYPAIAGIQIGSRIRLLSLDGAAAPASQVDVIVEGWSETITSDTYTIVFDTSPADNPSRGVYDDATYGRYGTGGNCSIHTGGINNSTTTVVIDTAGSAPTFTTTSARYPMKITVEAERIQLNSAPGGSTSPQTFTGVTRGVDGTPAAAHSAGALVEVANVARYTL